MKRFQPEGTNPSQQCQGTGCTPRGSMTPEQRARTEANRQRALKLRADRKTGAVPCTPPASMSQSQHSNRLRSEADTHFTATPQRSYPLPASGMTREQDYIVSLARRPNQCSSENQCPRIVRVTAGAGTGKTTTLEALARRLNELGHKKVLYVTFNKTAACDAQRRLTHAAKCRTIHSAAFSVFPRVRDRGTGGVAEDAQLDRLIRDLSQAEILEFTCGVRSRKIQKRVQKRVATYIRKTCISFMQGKKTEVQFFTDAWNTYYPAKQWHDSSKLEKGMPKVYGLFYVVHARKLWLHLRPGAPSDGGPWRLPSLLTFDGVMKAAQLARMELDCTALLVDEAQDCTECQIDWLKAQAQARHKPDVFFVGDAVQTIYSFRGAKSKFLMNIRGAEDATLTKSFRFGPNIAAVANSILFLKEKSPQKDWKPYRLSGVGQGEGQVYASTTDPRVPPRRTLLAWSNVSLIQAVLPVGGRIISINGDGPNSGIKLWQKTLRDVAEVYELTLHPGRVSFSEWDDDDFPISYDQFKRDVEEQEISKYMLHIGLVEKFQKETLKVVEEFQRAVVDKRHPPEGADLVLSTIHAAKGMEWDHVEVVEDPSMANLAQFMFGEEEAGTGRGFRPAASLPRGGDGGGTPARFARNGWGDEVHLWYVAVTRARRTLVLPPRLLELFAALETARALAARLWAEEGPKAEGGGGAGAGGYASPSPAQRRRQVHGIPKTPDSSDLESGENENESSGEGPRNIREGVLPWFPVCQPPLPLPTQQPLAAEEVPPQARKYLLPPFTKASSWEKLNVIANRKCCPQIWTKEQIIDIHNELALPWANEVLQSNQGLRIFLPPLPPSESSSNPPIKQEKI